MRAELAALVVHDLKNALGGLEAQLQTLSLANASDPALASAHHHCSELRERFVGFLTLYDLGGRLRAQPTDESPNALLEALVQQHLRFAPADAAAPRLRIDDSPDAPPFWYFDRHLVRLALQAALHNALRFAHREVRLSARRDGAFAVLSIDDDGAGLGAADPSVHSTGLGTALCQAVAAAHVNGASTGRATLANRPTGGARFELWLP